MTNSTSEVWDLLHELAGCVPFSKPDLYDRVQKVLDGGKQGIADDAVKHKLERIINAAALVVHRHDNGALGESNDSVSIERLRELVSATSSESTGESK